MSKPLASSGDLLFPVTQHSYTRANAEAMRRASLSPLSAIDEGRRCPRPSPPGQASLPGHGPEHGSTEGRAPKHPIIIVYLHA
jgi:hypothetical protein